MTQSIAAKSKPAGRNFTRLSMLSLALCALVAVAWMRADYNGFQMRRLIFGKPGGMRTTLIFHANRQYFAVARIRTDLSNAAIEEAYASAPPTPTPIRHLFGHYGFLFEHVQFQRAGGTFDTILASLPPWLLAAIFAWMPIRWLIRNRARFLAVRVGCCAVCGYDLRASPSGCPECGAGRRQ